MEHMKCMGMSASENIHTYTLHFVQCCILLGIQKTTNEHAFRILYGRCSQSENNRYVHPSSLWTKPNRTKPNQTASSGFTLIIRHFIILPFKLQLFLWVMCMCVNLSPFSYVSCSYCILCSFAFCMMHEWTTRYIGRYTALTFTFTFTNIFIYTYV